MSLPEDVSEHKVKFGQVVLVPGCTMLLARARHDVLLSGRAIVPDPAVRIYRVLLVRFRCWLFHAVIEPEH